jgi:hypothetical protein
MNWVQDPCAPAMPVKDTARARGGSAEVMKTRAEYLREWRTANPAAARAHNKTNHASDTSRAGNKRRAAERDKWFTSFLSLEKSKPCMDCKHVFPPCAMDFDHVRGKKEFSIGNAHMRAMDSVLAEIAKCDLVCACCHRVRTAERRAAIR